MIEAIKKKEESGHEPIQSILDSLDVIYYRRNKHLQPFVEELDFCQNKEEKKAQ